MPICGNCNCLRKAPDRDLSRRVAVDEICVFPRNLTSAELFGGAFQLEILANAPALGRPSARSERHCRPIGP